MPSVTMSALTSVLLVAIALATTGRAHHSRRHDELSRAKRMKVNGAVGPESLAFDPRGRGPYTGVADGRILKWQGEGPHGWMEFAVTSSQRQNCTTAFNPEMEHICGRPLGLRFNQKTGDLYIADAYLGIQVVGPGGGLATPLVTQVEGQPLRYANDVDVDENNNVLYFTYSSTIYQRRESALSFLTMDKTGRFMKYDIASKQVTVLMRGLAFANGVCLSKDRTFVLVAESTALRIHRFWIQGPNAGKHDIFARVPGLPDNIRTNPKGNFWVGLVLRRRPNTGNRTQEGNNAQATVVKLSNEGKILKVLKDVRGKRLRFIGEVDERNGKLWIGSAVMSFIGIYSLK